jgi:hypothetical protein
LQPDPLGAQGTQSPSFPQKYHCSIVTLGVLAPRGHSQALPGGTIRFFSEQNLCSAHWTLVSWGCLSREASGLTLVQWSLTHWPHRHQPHRPAMVTPFLWLSLQCHLHHPSISPGGATLSPSHRWYRDQRGQETSPGLRPGLRTLPILPPFVPEL